MSVFSLVRFDREILSFVTTRTHIHIVVLFLPFCFKKNPINELVARHWHGPHTRHLLPPPGQVVVLRELQ
jgi:hypothetical protein